MSNIYEIDALIAKYLIGHASPEEAMKLDEWKSESTDNLQYFLALQKTMKIVHNQQDEIVIDRKKAWTKIQAKKKPTLVRYLWPISIAASLTLVLFSTLFIFDQNEEASVFTSAEEKVSKTIADGTNILLDKNTKVLLDKDYGKKSRKLTLEGKALFTVKHDEQKPFIVAMDNVFLEDLGTIFSVENYPDNDTIFVIVKEGIVRLYDQNGSELIIKAGEKAWYIKSQKLIVTDLDAKVVKFNFKDTKLNDIVSILDDSFNEEIKLQPASIGRCKITTQFFDEDIKTIVDILAETLDFTVERIDGKYIIKGKPCQ
jgi:transmembrane sensor